MSEAVESDYSIINQSVVNRSSVGEVKGSVLNLLVPRVGVEPTRPYGQRILRTLERVPRSLTKRYELVFTGLAVVKGSLRLASYQHVRPPSWPHLQVSKKQSR